MLQTMTKDKVDELYLLKTFSKKRSGRKLMCKNFYCRFNINVQSKLYRGVPLIRTYSVRPTYAKFLAVFWEFFRQSRSYTGKIPIPTHFYEILFGESYFSTCITIIISTAIAFQLLRGVNFRTFISNGYVNS